MLSILLSMFVTMATGWVLAAKFGPNSQAVPVLQQGIPNSDLAISI